MRRSPPAAPGLTTWGFYAVTTGAAPVAGGSVPGLVPAGEETAFWAAWWSEDPRRRRRSDPDAYGFVHGAKAAFVAGCEAESRIRREKSARAYVISIDERFARAAYREGAPRARSSATDWKRVASAWCKERGIPRTAVPAVVKQAWRDWLKSVHGGKGAAGIDLDRERRRYQVALTIAEERATKRKREDQAEKIAAGVRPIDPREVVRRLAKAATAIAGDVRARLDAIAAYLELNPTLAGLCHFAALGLVEALREADLHAVVASQGGHSWAHVLVDGSDPILLDITASQYGLDPVYVRLPWQKRRWPHSEVRVKGGPARAGAQYAADAVVERAPARWWALTAESLPAALRKAGTRLTVTGELTLRRIAIEGPGPVVKTRAVARVETG